MMELLSVQTVPIYEPPAPVRQAAAQAQPAVSPEAQEVQAQPVAPVAAAEGAEAAENHGRRPYDEYTNEDPAEKSPIGLYRVVPDDEGAPTVEFDDPEAAEAEEDQPALKEEHRTTTNTDQVDQEIEELQARRDRLELRIAAADPEQADALREQLARLDQELLWKNRDTYRQRHAKVTEE